MKTINTTSEATVSNLGVNNRSARQAKSTGDNAVMIHGLRITRDLQEAEAALDEALLRQANLLATMVRARQETAVGPFTGHDALLRLTASQKAILQASGELARVHGKLLEVGHEVKAGIVDDCPAAGSLGDDDVSFGQIKAA